MILGLKDRDDAGVYKLRDDLAVVEHLDFFTPIVDDPYDFGQVAAANALSDIYAKGGRPITAMNIVCFSGEKMDIWVLGEILRGGLNKLTEAGVALVGGHSVDDPEIKYGLAVTGLIHPKKIIKKKGAKAGDALVLTKAIGTGVINTAMKAGVADKRTVAITTRQMKTLNRKASEIMLDFKVHAATDVTGFGLLGHAYGLIEDSSLGLVIDFSKIPLLPNVGKYVREGLVPGGTYRNRDFRLSSVETKLPEEAMLILFDPQTSGGLLIALSKRDAEKLVRRMREEGIKGAVIIGEVVREPKGKIRVI